MLKTASPVRFRFFAAFGLIALVLWLAFAFALNRAYYREIEDAQTAGRNLARSLAEHEASSVRAIDLSLTNLSDAWVRDPASFAAVVARQQEILKDEPVSQVTILDADGKVAYTNVTGEPRVDLSDRPYFRAHKERGADELYISTPFLSRLSGQWIILFSRPIYDRHKQFAGVVLLSVLPPALERIYNDIELGAGGVITLARSDGRILAHSRDLAGAVNVSLADAPGIIPGSPPSGQYRRPARQDGVDRFFNYHKVAHYPLTVYVGQAASTVFASYHAQRTSYLASAAFASALLLAVTLLLISKQRSKEETDGDRAWHAAIVQGSGDAILSLDLDGKIESWNAGAERLFGYAAVEAIGRNATALIVPPDRMEEPNKARERIDQGESVVSFDTVRVAKDGRRIDVSVSMSPVKDLHGRVGGISAILHDITERRRTEEKIQKLNENLERHVRERTTELTAAIDALQTEVKERRLAETSALSLAARVQDMARRLGQAQEVERRRLAAELHDGVCSNLAAIGLNLALLKKQLPLADAAAMEQRLSGLIGMIDEAKANAKDISVDLRPLLLDERDLLSALEEYAQKFESSTGIAIAVTGAGCGRWSPAEEKIALFRIAQEALTNCAKHARAKKVAIELNTGADHLVLSVSDDGVGFDFNGAGGKKSGLGLVSMQERAEAIGGKWRIESMPGKGTRVSVRVGATALA